MNPHFKKVDNVVGWAVFAIALAVYWITMEPTASYWDCGEFIAVSYKLEVPHPPGAPLFLLVGRLFSFLSFGDETMVAYWINFSSALAGAFTSMFMFWSVVLLGRKIMGVSKLEDLTPDRTWVLMGAGLVGSLTYTFCDSAWFSNVEAEVYAMSSFFTAFVVWAMLKWELIEDEAKANRWLILIFYMMGLSIGVHLLNLVTIPALALIYYFKKYQPGRWGIIATMLISLFIIFFINSIIIPGLPSIAGNFEVFFVNSLGLPFGSGAIFFAVVLLGALVYGIRYSQKNAKPLMNTFMLATAFILIGYSSYSMIVIRANFNPPINENDPSDVMSFVRYLKREQYGSRPLLYGQYFTAQIEGVEEGAPVYVKGKDKYEISDRRISYTYSAADQTFFPRIWSTDPNHQRVYRDLLGLREGERPGFFSDNLYYMFSHQIGWMYLRYFFFNFAGRESDIQNADWLKPSKWFEDLPETLAENKGRNNFFMIPFLLGLVGLLYQSVKDTRNFAVVGLLFILTGVALVIYLNSPPVEPRERDYIYTGSYYAFSFWVGFSVIAFADLIARRVRSLRTAAIIATVVCMSAPVLMAKEGWDDHDRSDRYFSVDSAINYLQSCAPNAILFTGGDNDTFPLWYSQEVEGIRTDMRVVVLSYYNTDWYIRQTMRPTYESEAFPYTLSMQNYRQGGPNDYLPFYDANIASVNLKDFLDLLSKDHQALRLYPSANAVPSRELVLKVDVDKVRSLGIVPPELDHLIVPEMRLTLRGNGLEKKDLAMLDVLATSDWERPMYVNNTSLAQFNVDLSPYVVQEGNAYRILPVLNPDDQSELVNTNLAYKNVTEKFQFRNLDDSTVYYSPDYRQFVQNHRSTLNSLAAALINAGDSVRAREVLQLSLEKMPDHGVPYDYTSAQMVQLFLAVGESDQALEMAEVISTRADDLASHYLRRREYGRELQIQIVVLGELQRVLFEAGYNEIAEKIEDRYNAHYDAWRSRSAGRGGF